MTSDPSLFVKKVRHLSLALIVSGILNILILSLFLYWVLHESPPTPYCELKPATSEQQLLPLADQRGCAEALGELSQLSFNQLISKLSRTQLIENGYAERDLALSCLLALHHFDLERALSKEAQPQQKRLFAWKPKGREVPLMMVVHPDMKQEQFDAVVHFAKTERWPLTAEGLFAALKEKKEKNEEDVHLLETFVLTPEFWTVELLFNRSGQRIRKEDLVSLLLEGDWSSLKRFVDQQRQLHDPSDARRQRLLLDYLSEKAPSAAVLLLKLEWDFSVKKLNDQQVILILQLMPQDLPEALSFAKEMLVSPRSYNVWKQASEWLYKQANEPMPSDWTHQAALIRFVPDRSPLLRVEQAAPPTPAPKPPVVRPQPPAARPQPIVRPQIVKQATIKPPVNEKKDRSREVPQFPAMQVYVVQEGDSLWKIAGRFGVKVDEIKAHNQLKSDALKKGTVLKIPKAKPSSQAGQK